MSSRVGDICLFMFIADVLCQVGLGLVSRASAINVIMICIVAIGAMTKRAQFPLSSWLPLAIRAPTPVRSLVHSSTLVVAGVWLLMKFRVLFHHRIVALTQCRGVMLAIILAGLVTLIISSIIAIVVLDVKKIIALSTLRQVGFMFLRIGFRWLSMSYFHLLSHAFYKSCIFIHVGITLLTRFHQQDKRNQSNAIAGLITTFGLILTLISLSGLIFSSGLVSKESVINISTTAYLGRVILIVVFIRIVLTCYYSTRIIISMNSIYNRLNTLIIVGTCSSGLLTLRLVFRWIITSNLA